MSSSVIQESAILKPEGSIILPARDTPLDPNEFWNRKEIRLFGRFRKRILPALKSVASTPERVYGVGRLKKNVSDYEIRCALPVQHLANWEDAASLIEMFPNGTTDHDLLYLEGMGSEVFAVLVYWDSVNRRRNVRDYGLVEYGNWLAGDRVLCPDNRVL